METAEHALDLTRHPMATTTITSGYNPTIPFLSRTFFGRSWNRPGNFIDTDETIDRCSYHYIIHTIVRYGRTPGL